jgi:hypothetical protein
MGSPSAPLRALPRETLAERATDELGRRAVGEPTTVRDFYATVLHLLGFDHTELTWYPNGPDRRLTDAHGSVLKDLLR